MRKKTICTLHDIPTTPADDRSNVCGGQFLFRCCPGRTLCEPSEEDLEDYMDSYGILHPQVILVSYNEQYGPKIVLSSDSLPIVGHVLPGHM